MKNRVFTTSSQRFGAMVAVAFSLIALPFLLFGPSGAASAGLSSGFMAPIEHLHHLLFILLIGLWAPVVGREATLSVPVASLAMVIIGLSTGLLRLGESGLEPVIFAATLLFAASTALIKSRMGWISLLLCSIITYRMGATYAETLPEIASPISYLLGASLSFILLLAIAVSLSVTLMSEGWQPMQKLRESPLFASLF